MILRRLVIICVSLIALFVYILTPGSALAQGLLSPNYEIQMPNLNFGSATGTTGPYNVGFTGGQTASGPYSSTGYKVLAGFWYLKTIIPFSFTLSNNLIDFGTLNTNTPKTASTVLSVTAGGAGGYQVTAQENHPMLMDATGIAIPDTTCDNGLCTEAASDDWTSATTYGFGYTMYGQDVPSPFPTGASPGNIYKQFADISKGESPQVIMSSASVGRNRTATLQYKINISAVQAAGRYHNNITYIATPSF